MSRREQVVAQTTILESINSKIVSSNPLARHKLIISFSTYEKKKKKIHVRFVPIKPKIIIIFFFQNANSLIILTLSAKI